MENKSFNGKHKAIKMPEGAAGEYAKYSCNFYIGCSNECTYCFNKRWKWGNVPKLKKCFKSKEQALEVFENELKANLPELQKHGLFFSFTTDPLIESCISYGRTAGMSYAAMLKCILNKVPAKFLTKRADWVDSFLKDVNRSLWIDEQWIKISNYLAFGFTLTGHDELEPNASTNAERIKAMRKLHAAGFKTWASIEPIIDFESAKDMIKKTLGFCDLYKIGLMSGKKYDIHDAQVFVEWLREIPEEPKIYIKESLQKLTRYTTEELDDNFVGRDYNLFNY